MKKQTWKAAILAAAICVAAAMPSWAADGRLVSPVYSTGLFDPSTPTASTYMLTTPQLAFKGITLDDLKAMVDEGYSLLGCMIGSYVSTKGTLGGFYNLQFYPQSGPVEKIVGDFSAFPHSGTSGAEQAVCVEFTNGEGGVYVVSTKRLYKNSRTSAGFAFVTLNASGVATYAGELRNNKLHEVDLAIATGSAANTGVSVGKQYIQSGNVKVVKSGSGTLTASAVQWNTGGFEVAAGTLAMGVSKALGAKGGQVVVRSGATLDAKAMCDLSYDFALDGGTFQNVDSDVADNMEQLASVRLTKDSSFNFQRAYETATMRDTCSNGGRRRGRSRRGTPTRGLRLTQNPRGNTILSQMERGCCSARGAASCSSSSNAARNYTFYMFYTAKNKSAQTMGSDPMVTRTFYMFYTAKNKSAQTMGSDPMVTRHFVVSMLEAEKACDQRLKGTTT